MKLNAIVRGRVQGVGFRYFVLTHARELGLKGWVRNVADGSVEVEAWGTEDALESLEQHLWKGSHFSWVQDVQCTRETEEDPPLADFRIA